MADPDFVEPQETRPESHKDPSPRPLKSANKLFESIMDIRALFNEPTSEKVLLGLIGRQVLVCRNTSGEDGYSNDCILCRLWKKDPSIDNKALFSMYVNEYMPGMKMAPKYDQKVKIVHACLAAGKAWDDAMEHPPNNVDEIMSTSYPWAKDSQSLSLWSDETTEHAVLSEVDETSADLSTSTVQNPKISTTKAEYELESCSAKTMSQLQNPTLIYRQALVDYYLADANKSGYSDKATDKFNNVRFLRDTTENILRLAEQEGLENSGLYRQVDKVFKCSRKHALYLAGDRHRHTKRLKAQSSDGTYDLDARRKKSFRDRGMTFAPARKGKSDDGFRSYRDSANHDDGHHGKVASSSKSGRAYYARYHGRDRYSHQEDDDISDARDARSDDYPRDDIDVFDDYDTMVNRRSYRDRSSYHGQDDHRQAVHSDRRTSGRLWDSYRPSQ
ncbi:hypothetical protein N7486_004779 [Penicillium sp. IBT 16267x]|nr:hypothetical protein N7486_004779 [Penicillium sp. IBT 16267x]